MSSMDASGFTPMPARAEDLERLVKRVAELERRVAEMEGQRERDAEADRERLERES
jgi:HD superfamily phosphodiesterase